MRQWINLFENDEEVLRVQQYLRGEFYHGMARELRGFSETAPAFFTHDKADAIEFAKMESEVDGDTPYLIKVRLHCVKPCVLERRLMQDLRLPEHRALVDDLLAQGYDCATYDGAHDEICVIDPRKIEVIKITRLKITW